MSASMSIVTTQRVYYIRHGQSQWNAAQTQHRREEMPEEEIKALGRQEYFTDSPLSKRGVEQALALQRRLFDKPIAECGPAASRSLAQALACTVRLNEPLPVFLTSNLRRAVDTTLVALRPLVERGRDVIVLPALQENSTYWPCAAHRLARAGGSVNASPKPNKPLPTEATPLVATAGG